MKISTADMMLMIMSLLQHHQKEIFSAILTEYTDWASVSRWKFHILLKHIVLKFSLLVS